MSRPARILAMAAAAIVLLSAFVAWSRASARNRERDERAALERRYEDLRDSLQSRIERDPILRLARADSAGIAVAMDESLLVELLEEATQRYLDRIEIDLEADFGGHGEGDVETRTPFGEMTLGEWGVRVAVHEMKAVLSTRRPTLEVAGSNRLRVGLPVRIEGGRGAVTLDFLWNAKGIFNLVCKDWRTRQTIEGAILPRSYLVRGDLVLSGGPQGIVADPDFPQDRFPIAMDPTPESWNRIRSVLEEQDALYRCGLLVKPETIVQKLKETGLAGLRFRLPRKMFRTISLPAGFTESVRILEAPVAIAVATDTLRIASGLVWYGADIQARRAAEPAVPLPLPSDGR